MCPTETRQYVSLSTAPVGGRRWALALQQIGWAWRTATRESAIGGCLLSSMLEDLELENLALD